ncbi:hypothetical protein ACGFX4_36970 [Kitasatospora sp. NPDC048365]|uniref:hypothetical protein n=1 Tax=Kitasatospora sp. NPDC048365 TaxID=3364050 RepID=UPI0037176C61
MTTETSTTTLRHHVRLVHASTGAPIGPLAAELTEARYGWATRTVPDGVVVTARADAAVPSAPPSLAVTVTDGAVAQLLVFPPVPGRPPHTVVVELTAPEIERPLRPVPMTLTVTLVAPSTTVPRTGRTVTARATAGPEPKPEIALPEAEPGVYASAPTEWTAALTPVDLLVDGTFLRTVSMSGSSAATRIRLVDTT